MDKLKKALAIFFLSHVVLIDTYGQNIDKSKYEIQMSYSDTIKTDEFIIIIQGIENNPYNERSTSFGKNFKEVKGYRLAEMLMILSKEANEIIKIKDLKSNPETIIRIEYVNPDFGSLWDDILEELAIYYKFRIFSEKLKVSINRLQVIDSKKLEHCIVTKPKPGVIGSTSISKDERISLTNCSIAYLSKWISNEYNLNLEIEEINKDTKYNFAFASKDFAVVKNTLQNQYGIKIESNKVEKLAKIVH